MLTIQTALGLTIGLASLCACGSDDRSFGSGAGGTGATAGAATGGQGTGNGGSGAFGATGGRPGSGGSGGGNTGGNGTIDCTDSPSSGGPTLIDDLEDQDDAIETASSMRTGWWYTFADATGTTTPAPGTRVLPVADPDDAMNYAVRVQGSGHTDWGAGVGVGFRVGTANSCLFDASSFSGVTFRAKGSGAVRFKLPVPATISQAAAPAIGMCTQTCGDDFGVNITLSAAWTTYTYTWERLSQAGWGTMATFSPATLTAAEWLFGAPSGTYDLYVDDLAFVP